MLDFYIVGKSSLEEIVWGEDGLEYSGKGYSITILWLLRNITICVQVGSNR